LVRQTLKSFHLKQGRWSAHVTVVSLKKVPAGEQEVGTIYWRHGRTTWKGVDSKEASQEEAAFVRDWKMPPMPCPFQSADKFNRKVSDLSEVRRQIPDKDETGTWLPTTSYPSCGRTLR
jgi:hypothetical protein